jgi:hypothetical protein
MSAPLENIAKLQRLPLCASGAGFLRPPVHANACALGATLAKLEGRNECQGQIHIQVWELVDFTSHRIRTYSYEVYRDGAKVCWYDAWEHPEIPALASTFPHHKHLPPDLRNNRVPAPGIPFDAPNLDVVMKNVRQHWLAQT